MSPAARRAGAVLALVLATYGSDSVYHFGTYRFLIEALVPLHLMQKEPGGALAARALEDRGRERALEQLGPRSVATASLAAAACAAGTPGSFGGGATVFRHGLAGASSQILHRDRRR